MGATTRSPRCWPASSKDPQSRWRQPRDLILERHQERQRGLRYGVFGMQRKCLELTAGEGGCLPFIPADGPSTAASRVHWSRLELVLELVLIF